MKKIIYFSIFIFLILFIGCNSSNDDSTKNSSSNTSEEQTKEKSDEENNESTEIQITTSLSDTNATENAKKLYSYLLSIYGTKVITGQMENAWNDDCNMLSRVYNETEKYPALMGFDFMNYTSLGWNASNVQTERAINFWSGKDYDENEISSTNGIVAFCWHWRDPTAESGTTGEFDPTKTSFRIPYNTDSDSWDTTSTAYTEMVSDLNTISTELLKLQNSNIPIIWRPLHEGAGNLGLYDEGTAWFWWGAGNSTEEQSDGSYSVSTDVDVCGECYIALWKLMYEYFTQTKGIHNLIWLWNGQNENFYPGDDYVDLIGCDIYADPKDYSSQSSYYKTCQSYSSKKMIALSECGVIPSMENISSDNSWWSYFMVWNDGATNSENSVTTETSESNFWSGEYYMTSEHKKEIYSSDIALTLDELKISY